MGSWSSRSRPARCPSIPTGLWRCGGWATPFSKQPVLVGDSVHVEGEVIAVKPIDEENGLLECRWRVLNQHGRLVLRASIQLAGDAPRCESRTPLAHAAGGQGRLLVTGGLTRGSIAYAVAERAQQEGAEVVLTGFGRTRTHDGASGGAAP